MKKTISLVLILLSSSLFARLHPLETVDYVDIEKYMGTWYEIARFEQRFQRGCTAVKAEYKLRRSGEVTVINSCRLGTPEGRLKRAVARAWVVDRSTNAKLKVQFFWRRIRLPWFAGNYWIIGLGEDYEYAMVGDPSRKTLWILSRTKTMDEDLYQELVDSAEQMHFDVSKLIRTIH